MISVQSLSSSVQSLGYGFHIDLKMLIDGKIEYHWPMFTICYLLLIIMTLCLKILGSQIVCLHMVSFNYFLTHLKISIII